MSSLLDLRARVGNEWTSLLESERDGLGPNGQGGDIAGAESQVLDTVVSLFVMEMD